jgi:uncharacterized phiE125 gp8 family phage protein
MLTGDPADADAILPLAAAKARIRVIEAEEDADITRMRLQAIDFVERYTSRALNERGFQWVSTHFINYWRLPIGPITTVDGINYYDSDDVDVAMDAADWYFGGGILQPRSGTIWPVTNGMAGSVRISFTAGFEDAETQAPMLVAAVELGIAELFRNRERPDWSAVMAACDSYRDLLL